MPTIAGVVQRRLLFVVVVQARCAVVLLFLFEHFGTVQCPTLSSSSLQPAVVVVIVDFTAGTRPPRTRPPRAAGAASASVKEHFKLESEQKNGVKLPKFKRGVSVRTSQMICTSPRQLPLAVWQFKTSSVAKASKWTCDKP